MSEPVAIGYHAFTNDRSEEFGAILDVSDDGREVTVYVENAGEFRVSTDAVVGVGYEKVTFDAARLDAKLRDAIAHAHDAEIPNDDDVEIAGDDEDVR